ncbi:MAG: hypothetical protein RTU92_09085 [Candidatus Thorarchaeota archaeon]
MQKSRQIQTLMCLLILVLPFFGLIIDLQTDKPVVCIVVSEEDDFNINLALSTLREELSSVDVRMVIRTIDQWDLIQRNPTALVLIGHGQSDGLMSHNELIPWSELYNKITVFDARRSVVLACHSPSDVESGIYGFVGQIDAEAGGILAAWQLRQIIDQQTLSEIQSKRVIYTQIQMLHPLSNSIYFVHGYYGENSEFEEMISILQPDLDLLYSDGDIYRFDYFSSYPELTKLEVHYVEDGISAYADNFAESILANHTAGDQIDIVAYSLGGIITREMLRLRRPDLETAEITIHKVITLGTPHGGSIPSHSDLAPFVGIASGLYGDNWDTPIFRSLFVADPFMINLNLDPMSYSEDIEWYTIAGVEPSASTWLWPVFFGPSDSAVALWSAHLPFAERTVTIQNISHGDLIDDPQWRTFGYVDAFLNGSIDSDGDGLFNHEELYTYFTDPDLPDSDFDGMPDGFEVQYSSLDPNLADSDANYDSDGLTNLQEYEWNTNPEDSDTDDDELSDSTEVNVWFTNPLLADSDDDGLWDEEEVNDYGTNPRIQDTDEDDLSDYDEVTLYYTDPLLWDTDSDLMPDGWEALYYPKLQPNTPDGDDDWDVDDLLNYYEYTNGTIPDCWDCDEDALSDGSEVNIYGTDPWDIDTDNDDMPDGWEVQFLSVLNPTIHDSYVDSDGDLLTNLNEFIHDTYPDDIDTDDDNMPDGWEVEYSVLNPKTHDSDDDPDDDSLTNLAEYTYGTHPDDSDSDDDNLPDDWEVQFLPSLNPMAFDSDADPDNDFLTNLGEYQHGTSPTCNDCDGDTLLDGTEVNDYGTNPLSGDSDNDNMPDEWEVLYLPDVDPTVYDPSSDPDIDELDNLDEYQYSSNPQLSDSDSDGILDGYEVYTYLTDPMNSDSDYDLMPDGWEAQYHPKLLPNTPDGDGDWDEDGLLNYYEYTNGTIPDQWDSDGDFIEDGDEVNVYFTDPLDTDSDDDNFWDGHEINVSLTDPNNPDHDGDGLLDGIEQDYDANPKMFDTDSDGCDDGWEVEHNFNPNDDTDASDDPDYDSLTNIQEYEEHTDPHDYDSDDDTLYDAQELSFYGTSPIDPDTDDDLLPDGWEAAYGLNPLVPSAGGDPDGDGLTNLEEYTIGTNPVDDDSDADMMPDDWELEYSLDPLDDADAMIDSDSDGLLNWREYDEGTNPLDDDTDDDTLLDGAELDQHGTEPLAWSTDADILHDGQEIAWGYDPNDSSDPIPASQLISTAWSKSSTGFVRANDYDTVEYVKVYVKYKTSFGTWTSYYHVGTDYTPTYYGDYYVTWTIPSGYVQMKVYVKAYDDENHYLGSDVQYVTISSGGGGGDPPPL